MPETTLPEVETAIGAPAPNVGPRRRLLAMGVVLSVSFAHFIATGFYYLFQKDKAITGYHSQFGVLIALLAELVSLFVLSFVLSEQGRSWAEIGWTPHWIDLLHGIFLIAGSIIAARVVTLIFQLSVRSYTGHYVQPRAVHGVTGAGISWLTVLFVLVNPLFEELIVRGYTMSEVMGLGGSRTLAIFVSVLIQMSYHVYQGLARCIGLMAVFLVFSIYFSQTRRVVPVIIAHFWSDAFALMRFAA